MAILTKEKESKNTTHIHFSPLDKNFMCKLYLFWVSRQPPNQVTDFFFLSYLYTQRNFCPYSKENIQCAGSREQRSNYLAILTPRKHICLTQLNMCLTED